MSVRPARKSTSAAELMAQGGIFVRFFGTHDYGFCTDAAGARSHTSAGGVRRGWQRSVPRLFSWRALHWAARARAPPPPSVAGVPSLACAQRGMRAWARGLARRRKRRRGCRSSSRRRSRRRSASWRRRAMRTRGATARRSSTRRRRATWIWEGRRATATTATRQKRRAPRAAVAR
eukprot:2441906-Prymnesium_polylepis.1